MSENFRHYRERLVSLYDWPHTHTQTYTHTHTHQRTHARTHTHIICQPCGLIFSTKWSKVSSQDSQSLEFHNERQRVWCRTGVRYRPLAQIAHDIYGGGRVMVWRWITTTGRTELRVCRGLYYRDNVIDPITAPYAHRHGDTFIFKGNNAKVHGARCVQDHLQFRRITTLPWPAKSTDLSPVKHLWDILRRRVQRRGLTSHRTSTNSLMHSRRIGAGSLKQPLGGSTGAWGVVVPRARRRMKAQTAYETSVKLIYSPLPNSKSSSSDATHWKLSCWF